MVKAQNALTTKFVAGVTAIVMTLSAFAGFAPQAQAASDIDALCAVVASLQAAGNSNATLDALAVTAGCSASTVTTVAGDAGTYLYHPNVDFEFTRNLFIGSRGNDVKMLQKALNASADTQVAVSGAGSPGNETEYFGPATRNAVIKFQQKTGVTPALGYFYPLTRAEMNKKVAGSTPSTPTTPSTGNGDLNVSEKGNPSDDLFPQGVNRFVVAGFELEGEADVESITVRYNGDADEDDVIDEVMLLDEDMNILGDEESLDSDQEAKINLDLEVDGSMMLYVAVNATDSTSGFDDNDGLEFTFDVVEIEADGDVDGLPVSGAEFTVQDNIDLGDIDVTVSHENKTVEIGSEEEEFVEIDINANPDDTDDSVFVKSIRLKNEGDGDLEDLDNIYMEVDNEEFDGEIDSQDDDYVVFNFGNGFELEDGESEKFTMYADVTGGATDKFQFVVDETSDVYAESEDGYGMPFKSGLTTPLVDTGKEVTISAGDVTLSDNDEDEADEITVGDNIVIGIFDLDIEGEDITVDELKLVIEVRSATTTDGDIDDVLLEDVRLELDGNALTGNEDADWVTTEAGATTTGALMYVEFDNVELPEGDHEGIQIVATIADEVGNGTIYEVQDLEDASTAAAGESEFSGTEGDESDEDIVVDNSASFEPRDVEAADLKVEVEANTPSSADRTTSDDVNGFHMATVEFDARSSGEDIEVSSFELELNATTTETDGVEEITNCRLYDEDTDAEYELSDDVDGEEGETTYDFELEEDLVVPADENIKLEVRCDFSDDLTNGDTFTWSIAANSDVVAEGATTGNDENDGVVVITASAAAEITIASAVVTAQVDSDTPDDQVVKFGEEVVLGILEVEADNGEATIEEVSFSLSDVDVIDDGEVFLYFEGSEEDSVELTADGVADTIDNLNIVVEDGETITLEFRGDASLSQTGTTALSVTVVTLDDASTATLTPSPAVMNDVTVFEGVPQITLISDETNENLDTANNVEVFEIAIEADGEDVTVDSITIDLDLANVTLSDMFFAAYENASHSNEAGTNNETAAQAASSTGTYVFDYSANPIVIPDGDTYYFVLEADTTVSDDTRSIRATLVDENAEGIAFGAPISDTSDAFIEDDIEVLHRD